jgi:hypothetical protein
MKIMISLLLTSGLFMALAMVAPTRLVAQTASASASPSGSPTLTETTQRLRERIEKIVEEKRDQVEGALDELATQRRGFIGEIQRVSSETLTVKTNKSTQILPLTPTTGITKAGKTIPVDDIAVGDWAIVIGRIVDDEFQLDRLVISSASLRPPSQAVVLGTLSAITRSTATVQPRNQEAATQFNLVKTTTYQDIEGNSIRLTDIKADTQILAVGVNTDKGVEARVIRVLVPLANGNTN